MKKVILALAVVAFFTACNGGEATDTPKTDSPAVATPVDTTAKPVDTMAKPAADTTAKPAADTTKK